MFFNLNEYFKQKCFDRVHLRVVSLYNGFGGLHARSTLAAEWQRENGRRPVEIMELVCSPCAVLLAGVNSVNSRSFYSQTPSLARAMLREKKVASDG